MKIKQVQQRITFFLSSFRAGGGEKQMIEIANAFVERGYMVDILVLKPVGQYVDMIDARIRIISLDSGRIIFSLPKLISYLRREKTDVILTLDEYTHILALMARPFARVKIRVVLRIGNMLSILSSLYEGKAKALPFFVKILFKRADGIIANSKGVADDVIAVTGINPSLVTVIMNPKPREDILVKMRESINHEWFTNKTSPIIVAVGRLRVQKNFQLLIRALAKLRIDMSVRLVIVGCGREEARLRALVEETNCAEDVLFTGYVDNPYAYLAKADCFVATSLWEGMPNAVLEALVCGVSIIAADCSSGPREILAPDTDYHKRLSVGDGVEYAQFGALYAVNDETALVEAMRRFLNDSGLRKRYAMISAKRSKDFDTRNVLDEYARVLCV